MTSKCRHNKGKGYLAAACKDLKNRNDRSCLIGDLKHFYVRRNYFTPSIKKIFNTSTSLKYSVRVQSDIYTYNLF